MTDATTTTAIDRHVGNRLRRRREDTNITQQALAERLGVTFQQVQKYESGKNRMHASRIYDAACALDCEPAYFFEGLRQ